MNPQTEMDQSRDRTRQELTSLSDYYYMRRRIGWNFRTGELLYECESSQPAPTMGECLMKTLALLGGLWFTAIIMASVSTMY